QQTIYFNNQAVSPSNDYTCDAVYRLISAEGREHIGQAAQPQTTWDDRFRVRSPHPNDGQAMRRYTERYEYDPVGNFLQMTHAAVNGNWTRCYSYNEPSLIEPGKQNNRLSSAEVGSNNLDPPKAAAQAVLCWSEYYNGKWQPTKTSDVDHPAGLGSFAP